MSFAGGGLGFGDADDPNVSTQMARAVLAEVNTLRRNPAAYLDEIAGLLSCYNGKTLAYPHSGLEVETSEGTTALQDCLADLSAAAPLPAVMLSQAISQSCQQHVADLSANDLCAHVGSDGSTPEIRLARAGEHREQCGENIVFGMRSAKETVYHMLIDDGAPERGHRANLLNPDFRFAGLAFGAHPSAETATVLLLTDHFRAKPPSKATQIRSVAEDHLAEAAVQEESGALGHDRAANKHWDKLMQETKPDHLRVPTGLLSKVQAHDKPKLHLQARQRVPHFFMGQLRPQPSIDPGIIRAFTHRMDVNHDGFFEEPELQAICHQHQLHLSPEDIAHMFDEILDRRQRNERCARGIMWKEVCAAVQTQKRYVPVVDVHVELEGGAKHILTVEAEALGRWCNELHADFASRCPGLALPPAPSTAGPRNTGGSARVQELNAFIKSVLSAKIDGGDRCLQDEPRVQQFLAHGCGDQDSDTPVRLAKALCMSQRRLWAFCTRPYRETWLQLIRAAGLNPLVPLPEKFVGKPIAQHMDDEVARVAKLNVARPDTNTASCVPPGTGKMQTREPPPKVQVRQQATGDLGPLDATQKLGTSSASFVAPWEEKRQHTETLVNGVIDGSRRETRLAEGSTASGPEPPQLAFTFDARRKFQQVLSTQNRASDERRFLGAEQRMSSGFSSSSSLRRNRGTGAHSLSAPAGPRGHFHNSSAVLAADGSHAWPQSLDVRWDGEHIDHTRAPELRPNPKFSKLSKEEKDKQFSCFFGKGVSDAKAVKLKVAQEHAMDLKQYSSTEHEFRGDVPHRHGKFGRRAFDPQVREKPLNNAHGISEIETKPIEEFVRQQERVHEYLERAVPHGQTRHFKTHLSKSEMPQKYEELANREPVNFVMDGGVKRHQLGFFQNRHSDPTDMKLYSRPLQASQMDRKIPMA